MAEVFEVFMARQPIYNKKQALAAYELLYRSGDHTQAGHVGEEEAARSLVTSLVDIGLTRLTGDVRAFINVDQSLLASGVLSMLPTGRVVIEILETVEPTPKNVQLVKQLHQAGYTIALDDFVANAETEAFVPYADIIKFDVMDLGAQLSKQVHRVVRPGLSLLAEKVETKAQFEQCKRLGFEFFQGYFFSKPEVMKGASIPPQRALALDLATRLNDPDLSLDGLEKLIVADVGLAVRLLRMVKSAQLGLPSNISSIRQAVMFLGFQTVASMATLLAMSASSDKQTDLITTALVRARACESLAKIHKLQDGGKFFTVGLLSVVDAVLNTTMKDVLSKMPLDSEMNAALINPHEGGELGAVLTTVTAFEEGHWEELAQDFPLAEVNLAYQDAVHWASELRNGFDNPVAA